MKAKINYGRIFMQKIAIFVLSIFIITFSYISYHSESHFNIIKTVGDYIDDSLLYKRIYSDNNHENEVVIIKVDEKTLNELQRSDIKVLSFSKQTYATLIEKLIEDYKVAVVGIDIIFANKSYYGENDELALKDTLEKYTSQVVIATRGDNKEKPLCIYNNAQHGAVEIFAESRVRKTQINHPTYDSNIDCPPVEVQQNTSLGVQALGIEIYKQYIQTHKNKLKVKKSLNTLNKKLNTQDKKNKGYLQYNYSTNLEKNYGTFGYRSYSLIDIINGEDIDLTGKIILIGEVGTVLHDTHFTPIDFKYQMPGVELHANIITSLLYDSYLEKLNNYMLLLLAYISILFVLFIIIKTSTLVNIISVVGLTLLHLIIGLQLFVDGTIYPVFFMLYTIILTFSISYIYKLTITDKNRRFLKKAFSMYVSSDMVDMIYKDPSKLSLKGEKSEITVFFSDIADFTSLSEDMETETLFNYLNTYFSDMTKILIKNQGTLDKYIGDAVMAFFNAPLKVEKHEYLACKTAIEQMKKLKEFNTHNRKNKIPEIDIRIGINTGEVMHGNLGASGEHINYTVIGDGVNIASRLEAINKQYGSNIMVSENTYIKVQDLFIFRELDTIQVKGKNKSIKIYELLGELSEKKKYSSIVSIYKVGLELYYDEKYTEAIAQFQKNKNDITSEIMKDRCEQIIKGEIEVINGVFKFTTK